MAALESTYCQDYQILFQVVGRRFHHHLIQYRVFYHRFTLPCVFACDILLSFIFPPREIRRLLFISHFCFTQYIPRASSIFFRLFFSWAFGAYGSLLYPDPEFILSCFPLSLLITADTLLEKISADGLFSKPTKSLLSLLLCRTRFSQKQD